jgi:23S rRNA pseudouridine2605 synthase
MMRLNKFIADCGIASRRKSEELILQGRITVNNKTITKLSFSVNPELDEIRYDGEKIKFQKSVYYLLNKPKGVVTTTDDEKNRTTVVDLIKSNNKIYPVGRLDINTTGVLLLTNDGNFANKLIHPRNNVIREYEVLLDKELTLKDEMQLLKGIFIDNKKGKFDSIIFYKKNNRKYLKVSCTEGRNHFVKKMFGALKYNVVSLHRKSFAGLNDNIPIGSFRKLTEDEIKKLS